MDLFDFFFNFKDYYDTVSQSVQLCFRSEAKNAGTALYVTGLSSRVTGRELEEHFSKEGKMRIIFDFLSIFICQFSSL